MFGMSCTHKEKDYQTDNQGSVTAITDNNGTVTNKNTYNEYGVPDLANTGRFQYTGQVWLAEAQIYHYKARAYDPYLGRFLQTDPIGYADGMNMYAYVGGDPVNGRDPTGLEEDSNKTIIVTGQRCVVRFGCYTGDALHYFYDNFIQNVLRGLDNSIGNLRAQLSSDVQSSILKAACSALAAQLIVNHNMLVGANAVIDSLGYDSSEGTYLISLAGDITFKLKSIGGDVGVFVRGDKSDFGFFVSTQWNAGLDADIGGSLIFTQSSNPAGLSTVNEVGYGYLDVFGAPSSAAFGKNGTIGFGASVGMPGLPGVTGNVNLATATLTKSCVK